jgi:hypothetical protein
VGTGSREEDASKKDDAHRALAQADETPAFSARRKRRLCGSFTRRMSGSPPGWPDTEASRQLIKIFRKLPTGEQLSRQKPGGLKPGFDSGRCILFAKQGGALTNACFHIFWRRRIGAAGIFVRFRRLPRRQ